MHFKAFQACAASQGGCNNLTFGVGETEKDGKKIPGFGYYETIAGGAGAGPDWDGQSCVHVHMTNTAIGDVELTERTYPVIIHRFSRRHNTGGGGRHTGGDGCIRDIEFTVDLDVAILSQRRVIPPYGMAGGEPGVVGKNEWWKRKAKRSDASKVNGETKGRSHDMPDEHYEYSKINLGGSNQASMRAGDRIVIHTPGGGGYGVAGTIDDRLDEDVYKRSIVAPVRATGSLAAFKSAQMTAV